MLQKVLAYVCICTYVLSLIVFLCLFLISNVTSMFACQINMYCPSSNSHNFVMSWHSVGEFVSLEIHRQQVPQAFATLLAEPQVISSILTSSPSTNNKTKNNITNPFPKIHIKHSPIFQYHFAEPKVVRELFSFCAPIYSFSFREWSCPENYSHSKFGIITGVAGRIGLREATKWSETT